MSAIVVTRVKVQNFETFKSRYDEGEGFRRRFHVRGITVLRDAAEPNTVTILTRFGSVADAKTMLTSDEFKEATKGSSVLSGETFYNEVVEEKSY